MRQVRVMTRTREEDERDLAALEFRRQGRSWALISRRLGVSIGKLQYTCRKVAEDDRSVPDPQACAADYERAYGAEHGAWHAG